MKNKNRTDAFMLSTTISYPIFMGGAGGGYTGTFMLSKNKLLHPLLCILFLTLFSTYLFSTEPILTSSEKEYLANKPHFTVLVTTNNYPYEFLKKDGEFDGINIRFIKEILRFTKKDIHFVADFGESSPDFSSSLAKDRGYFTLNSDEIFSSKVFFLYEKGLDFENIDRFIVLRQENLSNQLIEFYPAKNVVIVDDIIGFHNLYQKDRNNIFVFDSFFLQNIEQVFKSGENSTFVIHEQNGLSVDFYLSFPRHNYTFWQITTKSISILNRRNTFHDIKQKFSIESKRILIFQLYENHVKWVLGLFVLSVVLFIFSIYRYKLWSFKLEKLLNNIKSENNALRSEKDTLVFQLENIKSRDIVFLQNMNNLAFLLDLKGNILFINHHCRFLLGYPPESLIGKNIDMILTNENKQKILNISSMENQLKNIISLKSKDSSVPNEIEIMSKDGLVKHFFFSANFIKSEKGTMQISCILQDISERVKTKNRYETMTDHLNELVMQRVKQLEESKERVKFVIDKAYNGIFMTQNNSFTLVNDALCDITGYSKSHFEKTLKFSDIIEESEVENLNKTIDEHIAKNIGYFIIQTKIKKYLGDTIDVEIHFTTVIDEHDKIILGVIHEMEIKKEFEEKRIQSEKLNTLLSFAITINDKINSPLNSILGYTELLESLNDDPQPIHKKAYKQIYDSITLINSHMDKLKKQTMVRLTKYNFEKIDMIDIDND